MEQVCRRRAEPFEAQDMQQAPPLQGQGGGFIEDGGEFLDFGGTAVSLRGGRAALSICCYAGGVGE